VPQPPEVEDHEVTWWHARAARAIDTELMWDILDTKSQPSLFGLFGPDLRSIGRSRTIVDVGYGTASLGILAPRVRPWLRLDSRADGTPTVRLLVTEGSTPYNLSVTDLRLFADDHVTPDLERIRDLQERIGQGVGVRLSVGLTRPFAARTGDTPVHWLQVNNIHLEDDPCWRLAPPAHQRQRQLVGVGASGPGDLGADDLPF
jgi:hypothetical protein